MQFRQKLAKAIRVISAPPFAAAAFALILYFNPAGAIVRRDQLVACLLGLSVGPVLAYPISAALHTGREKQRVIAMYISLLSYGVLLAWSLLRPNSSEFRFVCMTYFMSVIMLIVFNRLLHVRSSGHSCRLRPRSAAVHLLRRKVDPRLCRRIRADILGLGRDEAPHAEGVHPRHGVSADRRGRLGTRDAVIKNGTPALTQHQAGVIIYSERALRQAVSSVVDSSHWNNRRHLAEWRRFCFIQKILSQLQLL